MELLNIFTKIGDWFSDQANAAIISIVASFIGGLIVKHGWSKLLDKIAKKGKVILKELGDVAYSGSKFMDEVDKVINDDTGKIENSTKEVIKAGKELWIEGKDAIIQIRPKKELAALKSSVKPPKEKRIRNRAIRGTKW